MRIALALLALGGTAAAGDDLGVSAAVGAGGQGAATFGALELGFDAAWHGARIGLAARAVWLDGVFRRDDWRRPVDAVAVVRALEAHTAHLAIAAGGLAPSSIAHVADGYRAMLDDHPRTGVRGAVTTRPIHATLEIDDVIDPALIGAQLAWRLERPWTVHAAAAVDPGDRSALEAGIARRWERTARRAELGAAFVSEPGAGAAAVAFTTLAADRGAARWTATGDVRAGTGTLGGAFGPLYRIERARGLTAHAGVGAGLAIGVSAPAGWIAVGGRARSGGALGSVSAGAPLGRYVQAAVWAAASRRDAAGAAELRVAWARRLSSSLQLARMYPTSSGAMAPPAVWNASVWFAATTD